jgi:hypothetical protein
MRILRLLGVAALATAIAASVAGWQKVRELRAENELLRAQWQQLKEHAEAAAEAQSKQYDQELQRLRTQAQEVFKLRAEVSQLRTAAQDTEKLRAENRQLRVQNPQSGTAAGASAATAVVPAPQTPAEQFPREKWTFAGYSTPQSALVSAVWAMKEGKPQVYLDSLSPDEQVRMAKVWENKSEGEIAAKHQQDVSQITNVRVMKQQEISPDEVHLTVFIEGPNRMEIVSMKRAGADWKFGGFFRDRQQ